MELQEVGFDAIDMFVKPNKSGFVYLFRAKGTNRYKIGRSKEFLTRLQTIQKQSPFELELVDYFYSLDCSFDESYIHKQKQQYRVFGEWFELSSNDFTTGLNFMKSKFSEDLGDSCFEILQYLEVNVDSLNLRYIFDIFCLETIHYAKSIKGFQDFDNVISKLHNLLNKNVRGKSRIRSSDYDPITNYVIEYIKFFTKNVYLLHLNVKA